MTALAASAEPVTVHALLVLLGHFARHLGLLDLLEAVPLKQKTFTHAPHTKLIEFLLAVLAGLFGPAARTERRSRPAGERHHNAQWKREQHARGAARRDAHFLGRQQRLQRREEQTLARLERLHAQQATLRIQIEALTKRGADLSAENQALPTAVRIIIRLDAGFSTDANLDWLIEMGYTVLTKVHSGHTTRRLQRTVDPEAVWTKVGANAEGLARGPQGVGEGRARLEALQVRYALPEGWRYTTLLSYDEELPPEPKAWFEQYNGRQTLEAGIKENKGVFTMRRPLVRSPVGMQLPEAFALFAANFVRWAAVWVQSHVRNVPLALGKALREVRRLVRVLAHSRA